jgi:hypothetical protein
METEDVLKPLAVFAAVLIVLVVATIIVSAVTVGTTSEERSPPDGQTIDGQSPAQFQPESVEPSFPPDGGEITVEETSEPKRILVDTSHSNQFSPADFEPLTEVLFEAGHTIAVSGDTVSGGSQFGTAGYNATLEKYDAVIIIQPTSRFEATERAAVQNYTANGGRVLVMGEPSQTQVGTFTSTTVSFGADNLTAQYGVHMGSETIFNLDGNATDNNFKSILASPSSGGELADGVETVSFDSAGYIRVREDSDAEVLFRADEGATTLQTRRTARYPTVVRNGNIAFVADASFIEGSELRDVDNDVFVSNLLNFLVEGERPNLVEDEQTGTGSGTGTTPTLTPEPRRPPDSR